MFKECDKFDRRWFIDPRIHLGMSAIKNAGTGVFATNDIPSRTVIESSPVILVSRDLFDVINNIHSNVRNILSDYPFAWPNGISAFALGWGGLYNHSFEPNVMWEFVTEEDDGFNALRFRTKRDIKAGEELFIRYVWMAARLWFVDDDADGRPTLDQQFSAHGSMGLQTNKFFSDAKRISDLSDRGFNVETLGDWKQVAKKKEEEE